MYNRVTDRLIFAIIKAGGPQPDMPLLVKYLESVGEDFPCHLATLLLNVWSIPLKFWK